MTLQAHADAPPAPAAALPPGLRAKLRHLYRQDIPLGSEAGRLAAEAIFARNIFSLVPPDRFGAPRGWLATWSVVLPLPRRFRLEVAALVPLRATAIENAFLYTHHTPMAREQRVMAVCDRSDLPGLPEVWDNWRAELAQRLACPELDQEWGL